MVTPFITVRSLVLASASPRRKEFLQDMGLTFTCVRPPGLEPSPIPNENPDDYAQRAADSKCLAVAALHPHDVVIGADTVVALNHAIFGKPDNAAHALEMLKALSGRSHTVTSAICINLPPTGEADPKVLRLHCSTTVTFHPWPEHILAAYAATGEPMDKAGAYAIQGQGAFLVDGIQGSWSTVVGLPLTELMQLLLREKVIIPSVGPSEQHNDEPNTAPHG